MTPDETKTMLRSNAQHVLKKLDDPETDLATLAKVQEQIARLVLVELGKVVLYPPPRVSAN